jgi:hypothetical protein
MTTAREVAAQTTCDYLYYKLQLNVKLGPDGYVLF